MVCSELKWWRHIAHFGKGFVSDHSESVAPLAGVGELFAAHEKKWGWEM